MKTKILSLLLVTAMLLSLLTGFTVLAADVASFDLSATVDTVLSVGDSEAIVPICYDAGGTRIATPADGWTYAIGNSSVISILDGQVTAINEGVSVVTVKYGSLSKKIIFVVGAASTELDFEDTEDWKDVKDGDTNVAVVTDGEGRNGTKALALDAGYKYTLGTNTYEKTDFSKYITADVGTISFWFYDNGDGSYQGRWGFAGSGGSPGSDVYICMGCGHNQSNQTKYSTHGSLPTYVSQKGGTNTALTRSKGWHQFVVNSWYDKDDDGNSVFNCDVYIDGEKTVGAKGAKDPKWDLFTSMTFEHMGAATTYMDDLSFVDARVKHDVTVNYDAEMGTVTGVANGGKLSVVDGGELSLTATPADGCEIYKITVDDVEYAGSFDDIVISDITTDAIVNITFRKKVVYTGIDLSSTEKTVLSVGDETKLVVCGILEDGSLDSKYPIESGLTYKIWGGRGGDANCVTVAADGTVKAVCAGVNRVQVTYGSYSKSIIFVVGETNTDYTATFDNGDNGGWGAVANTSEIVADSGRLGTDGAVLYGTGTNAATIVPSTVNTDANVISFWFYDASPTGNTGSFSLSGGAALPRNLFTMGMGISTANKITQHGELPSGNNLGSVSVDRTEGWHQVVMYSRYRELPDSDSNHHDKLVLETLVYIDGIEFVWGTQRVADKKNDSGAFNGRLGGLFGALQWSPKGTSAEAGSKLIIDDLYIVDANDNPHVTVTFDGVTTNATSGTKGSVVYVSQNASTLSDVIPVSNGEAKIPADLDGLVHLKAVPNEGYEVDSFKIDGVAYALDSDNKISFNITEDVDVDVQFREVVTTPSIGGNADTYVFPGIYTHEGENYNSFVAYYKMLIPFGSTVDSYGMRVNGLDAAGLRKTADDVFGIRIFGNAVEEGGEYELVGYAVVDGEETTTSYTYTYTK